MKNNLLMDFSVNRENHTITIKREFAAKRPLVWDAFTRSEILDTWWAPKPWKAKTKSMDFREGGSWLYAMVGPEGEEHWSIVKYKTIVNQISFGLTDAFSDAEGNINTEMPQAEWTSNFADKNNNTLVTLKLAFDNLSQLEELIKMGFKEGLTMTMEQLDEILAGK
jgi:uncharacterized protein YndB with AHSA1/START domain